MTSTTNVSTLMISNAQAAARDLGRHAKTELQYFPEGPVREALAHVMRQAVALETAAAQLREALVASERAADARAEIGQKIVALLETCECRDVAHVVSRIGSNLYLQVDAERGLSEARATLSGGVHGAHTVYCAGLKPSEFVQRVLAHWEGYCAAQPRPLGEIVDAWGC